MSTPSRGRHDARNIMKRKALDGLERQNESCAVSAIARIDAEHIHDGAVGKRDVCGDAPSLVARANQIAWSDTEVGSGHAPSEVQTPFREKSLTNSGEQRSDVAKTATRVRGGM